MPRAEITAEEELVEQSQMPIMQDNFHLAMVPLKVLGHIINCDSLTLIDGYD